MTRFEFILIGVGLNDATDKGTACNPIPEPPDTCPKGVPTFRADEGQTEFQETGYVRIQGRGRPEVLGGSQFDTLEEAKAWLNTSDGVRFKKIFKNVFLTRVTARVQPKLPLKGKSMGKQ